MLRNQLHLEQHDPLTGAARRGLFLERSKQIAKEAADSRQPVHCVFIDVRRLKLLNDTLGHDAADLLLTAVGVAGLRTESSTCVFGRLGGDEFAFFLRGHDDAQARSVIADFKAQAFEEFQKSITSNPHLFSIPASSPADPQIVYETAARWFTLTPGMDVIWPDPSSSVSDLCSLALRRADLKMYELKRLQRLSEHYDRAQQLRTEAKQFGLDLPFSTLALRFERKHPPAMLIELYRHLDEWEQLSLDVGGTLLSSNPIWVQQLFDRPAQEHSENATPRLNRCRDVALVAQERLRRGIEDPTVIFPSQVLEREPELGRMIQAIATYAYDRETLTSALGFAPPIIGPDPGWMSGRSRVTGDELHLL